MVSDKKEKGDTETEEGKVKQNGGGKPKWKKRERECKNTC